jgi:hypothetical protein
MTNQKFCYWLQGYFEISRESKLTQAKVLLIENKLNEIQEELGWFTGWLSKVLVYFKEMHYKPETLALFTPEIMRNLNYIFHHVIDNTYSAGPPPAEWQLIHDGKR